MKEILTIIKVAQADDCHQLQQDFSIQRNNLKRHLKSLKTFEPKILKTINFAFKFHKICAEVQKTQICKNSQLDYYIQNGGNIFAKMDEHFTKPLNHYEELAEKRNQLQKRVVSLIESSKVIFKKQSKIHEKILKSYCSKCYPKSSSFLFMIGLTKIDEIQKVENEIEQQNLLKQCEHYSHFLNDSIDQMQILKKDINQLGKQFYTGASQLWGDSMQKMIHIINDYEVDESELLKYHDQTGGAVTDRSLRSNKEIQLGELQDD